MRNQITRREFAAAAVGATALTLGANLNSAAHLQSAETTEVMPGMDEYCRQAMADWKVPGMAVAVIKGGKHRS